MSRKLIILSGFGFVIGSVLWNVTDEAKLFWIPLGIFLLMLISYAVKSHEIKDIKTKYCLWYLEILASGNIVKQSFYTENIFQWNDYLWGGICSFGLVFMLARNYLIQRKKNKKWATRIKQSGKK